MAAKDAPPVINLLEEEEEEEWPEAGAQNPEEVQQYVDRLNIFDHLSTLIHEDKKDALGQMIRNFKKLVSKQWDTMGDVDVDVASFVPSRTPQWSTSVNTSQGEGSRSLTLQKRSQLALSSYVNCQSE